MSQDRSAHPADELPPPVSSGWNFFVVLILVAAAGYVLASMLQMSPDGDRHRPMDGKSWVGTKAPAIQAEGWFNGEAPSPEDLRGKFIVVDAWAFWCGPCRDKAPELIQLYEEYSPKGVVFLGLTSEGHDRLPQSRRFIQELQIPWPQGYGANATLAKLEVAYIPQIWVIDPSGTIVWDPTEQEDVAVALKRLVK